MSTEPKPRMNLLCASCNHTAVFVYVETTEHGHVYKCSQYGCTKTVTLKVEGMLYFSKGWK